jgi:protein-S-isoprenylcysteine O-methyltransferase Ste14
MNWACVFFIIGAVTGLLLLAALVLTFFDPSRRVWPLPSRDCWQFRFIWGGYGIGIAATFIVGILDWNSFLLNHWSRVPVGAFLFVAGLGFYFWGIRTLSFETTLGAGGAFIESGPYRYSRNPQYVGSIANLLGFGILCNSLMTWVLCLLGAAWFALAPLVEEPWLRERFGSPYEDYLRRVPRFLG